MEKKKELKDELKDKLVAPNYDKDADSPKESPEIMSYAQMILRVRENERFLFLQKEKMQIRRNFEDHEYRELGEEVAKDIARVESLKEEAKSAAADFKTQITNLSNMIKNNSRKISEGFEMEPITVEVHLDYETKKRVYINPLNEEILKEMDFRMEDFQRRLEIDQEVSIPGEPKPVPTNLGMDMAAIFDVTPVKEDDIHEEAEM